MLRLHSHEIQQPISPKRSRKFCCFAEGINATQTASPVDVNRSTVNHCFKELRLLIVQDSLRETAREAGAFELAASCFGARRIRGKRGCKAAGKPPIFGLVSKSFGC